MGRRRFLRLGAAAAAWLALTAHTPYRQWKVYRQKHLLIGSCRTDPASFALAERIAETLVRGLPESRARSSRAPDQRRVASLLSSNQWQVAVMRAAEAADLAAGRGLFETIGALPLRSLFAMGDHLLVCRPDFPVRHAWLVTATLSENAAEIPDGSPAVDGAIRMHPGARSYAEGGAPPPPPLDDASEATDEHAHPQ